MVPYFETGLQPTIPKVPYLETGGSNSSLFRNCLKLPVPTVPYFQTGDSNSSLFRNRLQPYLETFKKATTCSNISILKNCFQPYLELFKKATPVPMVPYLETVCNSPFERFHIFKLVVPIAPYLETGLQPIVPTFLYLETVCNCLQLFRNYLQRYLETCRKATPCSNGSIFRNCIKPLFQRFHI